MSVCSQSQFLIVHANYMLHIGKTSTPWLLMLNDATLDPSHKSHNASDTYSHSAPFCSRNVHISGTTWCIMGCWTGALWDLYGKFLGTAFTVKPHDSWQMFICLCCVILHLLFVAVSKLQLYDGHRIQSSDSIQSCHHHCKNFSCGGKKFLWTVLLITTIGISAVMRRS